MIVKHENYELAVEKAHKQFLNNKNENSKLDKILDSIDDYDMCPGVHYFEVNDSDFEFYRFRRKLIRGIESELSDLSITDIFDKAKKRLD